MRITPWVVVALALLASCSRPSPKAASVPALPPPATLDEVMRRTHFAFWPRGGAFEGGHDTYAVSVDAQGFAFSRPGAGGRALSFGVAEVARERGAAGGPLTLERRADGRLSRVGAWATELLENTEAGLEQAWHLAAEPAGEGDLVVRVPVRGAGTVTSSPSGLRFAAPGGGVLYGHGTWIDAAGARTPVSASFEGGAVTLRVPVAVLARSAYPAVLDPLISPEQDVEAPSVFPSWGGKGDPVIASNGSDFLVVWSDGRLSPVAYFAARVGLDGAVRDELGIWLPMGASGGEVSVASDGQDFLVVSCQGGVRVSASGQVLGGSVGGSGECRSPALAWNGTNYVLVNSESRLAETGNGAQSFMNIVASTITPAGALASTVVLTRYSQFAPGSADNPVVAVGGSTLLVAYRDFGNAQSDAVSVQRLTLDLALLDVTPVVLGTSSSTPRAAWDGQRFVVSWYENGLRAARITTAGAVVDQPPYPLLTAGNVYGHSLAGDPNGVVATWVESTVGAPILAGARLSRNGAISVTGTPGLRALGTFPGPPAVASAGASLMTVWRDTRSPSVSWPYEVFGLRLSAGLQALDASPIVVSTSPARQERVALAWNGSHYLAGWLDYRASTPRHFFARLARDGAPLAPLATEGPSARPQQAPPAIASDGSRWLVAWSEVETGAERVLAARVASSGAWLDDAGFVIAAQDSRLKTSPAVAWVGDHYLVAYVDANPQQTTQDVHAVAVEPGGTVRFDGGLVVSAAPGPQLLPRVAGTDGGALIAWVDRRDGGMNVIAARVVGGAQLLDPDGLRVSDHRANETAPAVAGGPAGFLVCWEDSRAGALRAYAARVSLTDGLLDDAGIPLGPAANNFTGGCAATWDGEQHFVAWSQRPASLAPSTLLGTWVSLDGGVWGDAGTPLTPPDAGSASEFAVALASPGHRQVLVGFTVDALADAGFVSRVRTRVVTRGVAPVMAPVVATTAEDTAVTVPLSATDGDGDPVSFLVVAGPSHGQATITGAAVRYEPAPDFHGVDALTLVADDGALTSAPVDLTLSVTPVDDVPVAVDGSIELDEDTSAAVAVPSRDADDQLLTLVLMQPPLHGTVTGQPPVLTYTPSPDFAGADELVYALSDGQRTSNAARVVFSVRPVPDAPQAPDASVTTAEDTPVDVHLDAFDADGDALSFEVTEAPRHGTLSGAAPTLRYAPGADFAGEDRLVFRVSDGTAAATGELRLFVTPQNDAPRLEALAFQVRAGEAFAFALQGADPEGDDLSFVVTREPAHGALGGDAPALVYTAAPEFEGEDELVFEARDGEGALAEGTVRFSVSGARPSCGCRGVGVEVLAWAAALALARRRRVTGRRR